jgi:hypothetical protein
MDKCKEIIDVRNNNFSMECKDLKWKFRDGFLAMHTRDNLGQFKRNGHWQRECIRDSPLVSALFNELSYKRFSIYRARIKRAFYKH